VAQPQPSIARLPAILGTLWESARKLNASFQLNPRLLLGIMKFIELTQTQAPPDENKSCKREGKRWKTYFQRLFSKYFRIYLKCINRLKQCVRKLEGRIEDVPTVASKRPIEGCGGAATLALVSLGRSETLEFVTNTLKLFWSDLSRENTSANQYRWAIWVQKWLKVSISSPCRAAGCLTWPVTNSSVSDHPRDKRPDGVPMKM